MDYKIAIVGSFVSCYPPAVSTAGSFPKFLKSKYYRMFTSLKFSQGSVDP